MKIIFRFRIDDASTGQTRRFSYEQNMPYVQVPRIGEAVVIPTNDPGHHLGARPVAAVIYDPTGAVILDFQLEGLLNDISAQVDTLQKSGYKELSPA